MKASCFNETDIIAEHQSINELITEVVFNFSVLILIYSVALHVTHAVTNKI